MSISVYERTYSDPIYQKKYFWGDNYAMFFVANPNKPKPPQLTPVNDSYYDVEAYNQAKRFYYQTYPELSVCHNANICCQKTFQKAGKLCAEVYQAFGLLDKGEYFNEDPDIFCVVTWREKIVGTLGYCYNNLPIKKTYHGLRIEKNTHELVRFAIDLNVKHRIEVLSEKIIQQRGVEQEWQKAKKAYGYRFKKINMTVEIGKKLFEGMVYYCKNLVKECYSQDTLSLLISTHDCIKGFFNKILEKEIFQEEIGEINWAGIPKKSHKAYQDFNFRPYRIKLWELGPEFCRKEKKEENIWDIAEYIPNISKTDFPPPEKYAVA